MSLGQIGPLQWEINGTDQESTLRSRSQPEPSRLFTLRVWPTSSLDGEASVLGRLRDLANGEAFEFSGWPEFVETLNRLLGVSDESQPPEEESHDDP